ncbi:MAG: MOSC domain-containing protein [Gemmatimonadota bacterium]
MQEEAAARVVSVNVGEVRAVEWRGRRITSGIWKSPVLGRVALRGVNFTGDDQADRTVHGGRDKAVYAYSREDYDYWRDAEGVSTSPGLFGENLTTAGVELSDVVAGERWAVGSTVLEVAQPRLPCFKIGMRMDDPHFPRRFMAVGRMGAYFRIVQEGDIGASDVVQVTHRPAHGVTLRDMVEALRDEEKAASLRVVPHLPEFWQQVADSR